MEFERDEFKFPIISMTCADVLYHHRGSVWGVSIQGDFIFTGSMDGTIAAIHIPTLTLKKHFLAHEDEWGGER